ncbi:hemolysin family protein [Cellulomonas shaoxiangyii]|uniref:HlyC/CorC family transporter n=1 Tax=Cellulomonas shaoxiangyii TaxID=2566013 RepID=A0A4P7SF36_9CELL|nr:hemolysin family protein [Cellulomonas shaoxiangyii]QCB92592.1 HlyC/CorC family transporter [Cellulomonas shaoxiangyii]TGY85252.1 HlyC/CorC family transporter [Cellulomonas shaoxiangyii]
MSDPLTVVLTTVALIALSAFFVAIEFAALAAKGYRLEERAPHSRSARAALRSSRELTVLLAGSQLGITACTLALGAVTKPAVHHWLTPVFEDWGAALWLADAAGFVLALVIVTFLHLVVGEMAPKSWAIAHPETSAIMLATPMRAFMWLTRPLLHVLNEAANWCLRRVGVEPTDQLATGQNPDDLRHLVEHSANVGALDESYSRQIRGALELQTLTVRDLVTAEQPPTAVPADATMADVRAVSRTSGHLRVLVGPADRPDGVAHVRDTLSHTDDAPVAPLVRPVLRLAADAPVAAALTEMRERRQHLAVVHDAAGQVVGVVTLADVLARLFPATPADAGLRGTVGAPG